MLRGINKQIIEIKCTNDEYFEKILLFVKAEKSDSPRTVLQSQAANYCSAFTSVYGKRNSSKTVRTVLILAALCALGLAIGFAVASLAV